MAVWGKIETIIENGSILGITFVKVMRNEKGEVP